MFLINKIPNLLKKFKSVNSNRNTSCINVIEDNSVIIKVEDGAKSIPIGKSYKDKLMRDINLIIK